MFGVWAYQGDFVTSLATTDQHTAAGNGAFIYVRVPTRAEPRRRVPTRRTAPKKRVVVVRMDQCCDNT